MSHIEEGDDIDDFLYGEAEPAVPNTAATLSSASSSYNDDAGYIHRAVASADEVASADADDLISTTMDSPSKLESSSTTEEGEMESDDESSSDSDIEFILDGDGSAPPPAAPSQKSNVINLKQTAPNKPITDAATKSEAESIVKPAAPSTSKVSLTQIAEYEGTSLLELDIDSFEDKPWRKPGSDITDYFNYGFNEATWKLYQTKQKALREEYSKKNIETEPKPQLAPPRGFPPQRPSPMVDGSDHHYREYHPPAGYRLEIGHSGLPPGPPGHYPGPGYIGGGPAVMRPRGMYGPPQGGPGMGPWSRGPGGPMGMGRGMMRSPAGYYGHPEEQGVKPGYRPHMRPMRAAPPPVPQGGPPGEYEYEYDGSRKRPPGEIDDPRAVKRRA